MAVYTSITKEELKAFLSDFDVGTLQSFDGISSGSYKYKLPDNNEFK